MRRLPLMLSEMNMEWAQYRLVQFASMRLLQLCVRFVFFRSFARLLGRTRNLCGDAPDSIPNKPLLRPSPHWRLVRATLCPSFSGIRLCNISATCASATAADRLRKRANKQASKRASTRALKVVRVCVDRTDPCDTAFGCAPAFLYMCPCVCVCVRV